MIDSLDDVVLEQRLLTETLGATGGRLRAAAREDKTSGGLTVQGLLLLQITESLIAAHRLAKIDGDEDSLELIEIAMRHFGQRLAQYAGGASDLETRRSAPS